MEIVLEFPLPREGLGLAWAVVGDRDVIAVALGGLGIDGHVEVGARRNRGGETGVRVPRSTDHNLILEHASRDLVGDTFFGRGGVGYEYEYRCGIRVVSSMHHMYICINIYLPT
ncbi:hypothetical protein BC938DRAFT_482315 [Jimgerdemannia flammicorona]|uniref:Uncharacterized protein n=1 Tax=Jimgerdemannia flammicorona TaxID=994334 RepID=A0A433QEB1_9FUNG|nr:hypothetical protein BC938DRAFT_482315 [Jimgerdemannia flammicorona]